MRKIKDEREKKPYVVSVSRKTIEDFISSGLEKAVLDYRDIKDSKGKPKYKSARFCARGLGRSLKEMGYGDKYEVWSHGDSIIVEPKFKKK